MDDSRTDFLFTLYFIGRKVKKEHKKHNEDIMLRMTILHIISKGTITLSELAQKVYSKLSSLSEMITHMESEGLIRRHQKKEDERESVLSLTPQGMIRTKEGVGLMKTYCRNFTNTLDDAEIKTVSTLLRKLLI